MELVDLTSSRVLSRVSPRRLKPKRVPQHFLIPPPMYSRVFYLLIINFEVQYEAFAEALLTVQFLRSKTIGSSALDVFRRVS